MSTPICEIYPDLYRAPPEATAHPDVKADAANENMRSARLVHAVGHLLKERFKLDWDVKDEFVSDNQIKYEGVNDPTYAARVFFMAVVGILKADNRTDPSSGTQPVWAVVPLNDKNRRSRITLPEPPLTDGGVGGIKPLERSFEIYDEATDSIQKKKLSLVISRSFVSDVVEAVKEYQASAELFDKVFRFLRTEGEHGAKRTIYPRQLAEVTRRLAERGVRADAPQLSRQIGDALSASLGGGNGGNSAAIDVDIFDLDLDAGSVADIVQPNVYALAGIYYASRLEEMKLFAAGEKVVEQFIGGLIPLTRGPGGERLYRFHRDAPNRLSEIERRGLYARAFGFSQGTVDEPMPNREFDDLWMRFLSSASLFGRQSANERQLVSGQQLFKSARDLAMNISLHGYAMAHFAAVEMQQLVRDVHGMLSDSDVTAAYGTRDVWQLVDRVSALYLGGAVNGVRNRTMAHSGSRIIKWLGDHSAMLSSPFTRTVESEFTRGSLLDDVERWLAVNGVQDTMVDQYSEPVVSASQSSIPNLGFNGMAGSFDTNSAINDALNAANSIAGRPAMPMPVG